MRLFLEYGFGKVTVVEIAKEAAVALPTLYANIGSKATILSTLIDEAITDPIVDETFSAILDSASAREVIDAAAHGTRIFNERSQDIMAVMKAAAAIDGTAGDMLLRTAEVYQRRLSRVARTLRKHHDTGLTTKEASDVLWFYLGPDAWHVLVAQRHWGWTKAERWLAAQAFAALANPAR
jgi:AcrR family transcriptional regulator